MVARISGTHFLAVELWETPLQPVSTSVKWGLKLYTHLLGLQGLHSVTERESRALSGPAQLSFIVPEAWLKGRMRPRTLPASGPLHGSSLHCSTFLPAISLAHPFLTRVSTRCLLCPLPASSALSPLNTACNLLIYLVDHGLFLLSCCGMAPVDTE